VALLALVGGLAAPCFVRPVGIAFLGEPRSAAAQQAHEGGWLLGAPALLLGAACVGLACFPASVVRLAEPVAAQLLGASFASRAVVEGVAVALTPIGVASGLGVTALLLAAGLAGAWRRGLPRATQETWACGYARPSARMQYGARSFSELLATRFLPRALAPRVRIPRLDGCFPGAAALASEERDPFTAGLYEPLFSGLARRFVRLRALQQGNAHAYVGYILGAVLVALAWLSWRARGLP
jgi:NADH:ubiquinone oxidoreductase subunit 5 (subunit L)/multisubunit Na+/H+ antiporter MnhA subunit